MRCDYHKEFQGVSLVGEAIMNYSGLPEYMEKEGWLYFRIEYGHECSCPEKSIFLPPWVDSDRIEELFNIEPAKSIYP